MWLQPKREHERTSATMRLINTETHRLDEFIGDDIPSYAILSHTWEEDEVTYQDFVNRANPHKKGWKKIWKMCDLAKVYASNMHGSTLTVSTRAAAQN